MKINVAKTIDINIDAVYNVKSYKEIYADYGLMGFSGYFEAPRPNSASIFGVAQLT